MNIEQPPLAIDEDLSAYLIRMFNLVDSVLGNIGKLPVRKILAPKPVVGKLYYYKHKIDNSDIAAEGLYIYKANIETTDIPGYVFLG